jgi:hypothetical protein
MINWLLSNSKSRQQFLIHIVLGLISLFTPALFIIWYYSIFLAFFQKIISQKSENSIIHILIFLIYSSSFEILGRMVNSSPFIPYELGKYMTFFLLIIGLFKVKKIGSMGMLVIILLMPGIIVGIPFYRTYKDLVFNVLGTINIGLGMALYVYIKITEIQLLTLLRLMVLPLVSILAYSIVRAPDITDLQFELGANKIVGGFGSNQISTVFGIALFILYVLWYKNFSFSGFSRLVDVFVMVLFMIFGMLTFSRGGMLGGLIGIFLFNYYQFFSVKKSTNIIYIILTILILWLSINTANDFTDGQLLLRYSGETNGTLEGSKEKDLNQLTTGRFNLFVEDFEVFQKNYLFGVGVKQSVEQRNLTSGIISHVEFGRLLAEHGLLGLLIDLLFMFLLLRGFRSGHFSFFNSIMFLFFLLGFYTSFHAATRTFVSPLLMPLIFIRQTSNSQVDKKNIYHEKAF